VTERETFVGLVKTIDKPRGYGFLHYISDHRSDNVFFHVRRFGLPADFANLEIGDQVSFQDGLRRDGRSEAINCRPVRGPADKPPRGYVPEKQESKT
jgi:cold shock CspA family protein